MEELPDLSRLTHDQKDDLIRMLFALIEQVRQLTARVAELEARLSKDSHNSSKPPSRDGLTKKTRSLRVSSVAKPGGQFGRVGKTLKRSNAVDVVIEYPLPQHCNACGIPLMAADAVVDKRRQVFDIPVARYQVTEHRTPQVHCTCGQLHQSQFPENVTEVVQYGPYGVHAKRGMLAMRRAWHPAQANWAAGARLLGTILATRLRARPVQCTPVARIDVFARNHRTELAQTHDGAAHPCPYTL